MRLPLDWIEFHGYLEVEHNVLFYYDPRKKALGFRRVKVYFRLQYIGPIRLGALGVACEVAETYP